MSTFVLAQRISTGEFLHNELPVQDLEITPEVLSGPQVISGTFKAEIRDLDIDLEPFGTWIHVEEGGVIRASGILQPWAVDEAESLSFDAFGVTSYPKGIIYVGDFTLSGTDPATGISGIGVGLDPADIYRDIWEHIQSYPDGDLGVTVLGDTGVLIGTPPRDVDFETGEGEEVTFVAGPYSKLDWWEAPDCGSEAEQLAKETPFDYVERCAWNEAKTDVDHWIEIGWPRIGTRRDDIRFVQGENMIAAPGPEEPDDRYASEVIVLGKGEGSLRVRGYAGQPYPGRLRRPVVVQDKTIESTTAANSRARIELAAHQALVEIPELIVPARSPNATLGAYGAGDDVKVEGEFPWIGTQRIWHRVLGVTYTPGVETVRLTLRASSAFVYGHDGS